MKNENLKLNAIKRSLRQGKVCFGTMLRILKSPQGIALCASQGWDYVILDTEHNDYNLESISVSALLAKYEDMSLFVRVPDKLYYQMAQILDLGAEGLVIPQVKTKLEAEKIVKATKYGPVGERGVSISDIATRYRNCDQKTYTAWANSELLNIIQIESLEGVHNLPEILSVGNIDGLIVGPSDLTQDMGIPGELTNPDLVAALRKIIEICSRFGVAPGIHLSDLNLIRYWINAGMRLITYSYDSKLFVDASRNALDELRSLPAIAL